MITIQQRISEAIERELSRVYDELGITSGDIMPDQYLKWEHLTKELENLFNELIEQNK